ncbi:hypothetical protein EWB00_006690 [Schistosoma japonicum]|uniref:Uncharacterized protein n=1 Tax=Schistosoma japonicum TaxID=6182 RepID=A0A4Z2CXM6_SCHJA|nr:hypothetical protein EWB00_006690 [Schistosoma japonicum]
MPKIALTSNPTEKSIQRAMREIFSRKVIPIELVLTTGSVPQKKHFNNWPSEISCRPLFTAQCHPRSKDIEGNLVRTLEV